jgi:hypothetical protein
LVHPPAVGSDFDGTPMVVGEIKKDVAVVLGDADVDGALGGVKLRPRLEQIELRPDRMRAQRAARGIVIAATEPAAKALAADGPGFPVTIDQEIRVCGAGCGVKQHATRRNLGEHVVARRRPGPEAPRHPRPQFDLRRQLAVCGRAPSAPHRCGCVSKVCGRP